MYARGTEDTLNIDFDILSVMNGINDIGFQIRMRHTRIAESAEACRVPAKKYDAVFVPLALEFDELSERLGADVRSADCIHLTAAA